MGQLQRAESFWIEKEFDAELGGSYKIRLKKNWDAGDQEAVNNDQLSLQVRMQDGQAVPDGVAVKLGKMSIAQRIILEWDVLDDDGKLAPVTPTNIGRLHPEVFAWVLSEWEQATLAKKGRGETS